mgnify:CR=1 FL=1
MEFFQIIADYIRNELNFVVVILVLVGGFGARVHLKKWKVVAATKALVGGSALVLGYILTLYFADALLMKDAPSIFFSYCFTAFMYPFIKKPFNRAMCRITGADLNEVDEAADDDDDGKNLGTPDNLSTGTFLPKFQPSYKPD